MITAEHYQELIMNFISLLEVDEQDCSLQHDGATVHTANSSVQMLSEFFGGRIISQNLWPPQSLDLSPSDFCLWGFLKEKVCKNNPHVAELKQNIELCISNITAETLHLSSCVRNGLCDFLITLYLGLCIQGIAQIEQNFISEIILWILIKFGTGSVLNVIE
jgi:hypothetical protein